MTDGTAHQASARTRWLEFAALFIGIPLLVRFAPGIARTAGVPGFRLPVIPVLAVAALASYIYMRTSGALKASDVFSLGSSTRGDWLLVVVRFLCFAVLLWALLAVRMPEALFALPRRSLRLWAMVMVFYPIASVLAQGIVYRAFFMKRYSSMFPQVLRIVAGAAVFSFGHIAFANPIALVFTFIGGLMFLSTYAKSGSLLLSGVEHALYGDLIFTLGWGSYFFHAGTLNMMSGS